MYSYGNWKRKSVGGKSPYKSVKTPNKLIRIQSTFEMYYKYKFQTMRFNAICSQKKLKIILYGILIILVVFLNLYMINSIVSKPHQNANVKTLTSFNSKN